MVSLLPAAVALDAAVRLCRGHKDGTPVDLVVLDRARDLASLEYVQPNVIESVEEALRMLRQEHPDRKDLPTLTRLMLWT